MTQWAIICTRKTPVWKQEASGNSYVCTLSPCADVIRVTPPSRGGKVKWLLYKEMVNDVSDMLNNDRLLKYSYKDFVELLSSLKMHECVLE